MYDTTAWMQDIRETASRWAREALTDPHAVILDTETTGLGDDDEIVEIAVIDMQGRILMNQMVRPARPIPAEATAVHGISDADVSDAVSWRALWPQIRRIFNNASRIVIYNAAYDVRLMRQSCRVAGIAVQEVEILDSNKFECAMRVYAEWYGEWSEYHGSFTWQPLNGGHRALGDCLATLERLREMSR